MKLRLNAIIKGRYILAGEDIPEQDVPPAIPAKYAVSEDGDLPPVKRKYAVARPERMYPGAKSKTKKAK